MLDLLVGILHLVVFPGGLFALALGLFLKGCDRRVEARLQRRVGPPLIQPFLDLVKLSTKEVIIPTSAVRGAFLAAPVVALGGIAMCAALLPVPGVTDGLPKMGDLLVIFYLFPIPAMAIMLAGSSSGSPYGGIGFSREMIMMLAYEVPLLMIMLTVAMKVGGGSGAEFSLTKIMDYQAEHGSFGLTPVMWPAFLAWLMFLPATLGVPPFDQPEAETEILEGPLLEYSGVLLAFFHMASALKMVVALALGVVLFFPGTISDIPAVNLVWFVVKCALFMLFTLTVVKSATGRLRIEQALSFFLKYPAGLILRTGHEFIRCPTLESIPRAAGGYRRQRQRDIFGLGLTARRTTASVCVIRHRIGCGCVFLPYCVKGTVGIRIIPISRLISCAGGSW